MIKEQFPLLQQRINNQQEIKNLVDNFQNREQCHKLLSFGEKYEQNITTIKQFQAQSNSQVHDKKIALWSKEQDNRLIQLHNLKGNKWVQIGYELKRSDNEVKNYYHSKLRKTFRKINRYIQSTLRNQNKPLKMNILSKIMQTAQTKYHNGANGSQDTLGLSAFNLKNKIIQLSQIQETMNQDYIQNIKDLLLQIQSFSKQNQRETKSIKTNKTIKYKAKEIKKLILENSKHSLICKSKSLEHTHYNNSSQIISQKQSIIPEISQQFPSIPTQNKFTHNPLNLQTYYIYNPLYASYQSTLYYKFYNQQSPQIYSQNQSAFTFVGQPLQDKNLNRQSSLSYLNENFMRFLIPQEFSSNI